MAKKRLTSRADPLDKIVIYGYLWAMNQSSKKDKLTKKQSLFALEYIKDFNASRAALAAGYAPKSAYSIGCTLLKNHKVNAAISRYKQERVERVSIDADYVLRRLAQIDMMDISDIFDGENLLPVKDWPKVWRTTLSALDIKQIREMSEDGTPAKAILKKIKWPDKLRTLELIGKHVGVKAFAEQYQHTHGVDDETIKSLRDLLGNAKRKKVANRG